jgi:hypothetical protein
MRPGNIVFDSANPGPLAEFWARLTGYEQRPLFYPYVGLRDPAGIGPNLTFQRVLRPTSPLTGRCHIDFYVTGPSHAAMRAEELGAGRVRSVDEGDTSWVVMADPEGNHFCFVEAVGPERRR